MSAERNALEARLQYLEAENQALVARLEALQVEVPPASDARRGKPTYNSTKTSFLKRILESNLRLRKDNE